MKLREKIVIQALNLYNERGIEYVGMRELAASLDIKLGNITYYFPKKEDLVYEIWYTLSQTNSLTIHIENILSLEDYFITVKKLFENQFKYRCLLLSFVHLLNQYESIRSKYVGVQEKRSKAIRSILEKLFKNGYLSRLSEQEITYLISAKTLLFRFWISEAAVSFEKLEEKTLIRHYLRVLANIMKPFCKEKGLKALKGYL